VVVVKNINSVVTLLKAMGEGGLKPTAKGNLPQKVVKQVYQAYSQSIYKPKYELSIVSVRQKAPNI